MGIALLSRGFSKEKKSLQTIERGRLKFILIVAIYNILIWSLSNYFMLRISWIPYQIEIILVFLANDHSTANYANASFANYVRNR